MSSVDGMLAWAEQLVQSAGALGLAGVMAAEAVLPISSAAFLPVLGARVSAGELALVVAVLATTAGSVLGSGLIYGLARWGSRRWVSRMSRLVGLTDERRARLEDVFDRRGVPVVVLGRVLPGVRGVVPLAAGSLQLPLGRFLVASAIGSAMWNSAWIGAGAWLTAHWDTVTGAAAGLLSAAQPAVLAAAVAGGVLILLDRTRVLAVVPRTARP
jgi:membrane protein DedA with SNARE-associated domain